MEHLKYLLLLPLLLFATHSFCQLPDNPVTAKPVIAKPVSAKQNTATQTPAASETDDSFSTLGPLRPGNLGLMIVASDTTDFIKDWLTTPPDQGISMKKTRWIKPGQVLYTAFLVTGLYYGPNQTYDYKVSFYVMGPDGKVRFGQHNYAAGKGKHPNKPTIYLADPALELTIQPEDPQGLYIIVASVEDQTNGKVAKNQYEVYVSNEKPEAPVNPTPGIK